MQIFKAFMDALEASRMRMAMGQPMAVGERKPRSRLVEKTDTIVEGYRKSNGLSYLAEPKEKPTKKATKKKG